MDYKKLAKKRDQENPFPISLGIKTFEIHEGYAQNEMVIEEHHMNFIQSVHGGCIFTLADTVGGAAASSYGTYMTTISSDFHYLTAAQNSIKLIGTAQAIKHGSKITVIDVEIRNEKHKLIAKGTFSYYDMKKVIEL